VENAVASGVLRDIPVNNDTSIINKPRGRRKLPQLLIAAPLSSKRRRLMRDDATDAFLERGHVAPSESAGARLQKWRFLSHSFQIVSQNKRPFNITMKLSIPSLIVALLLFAMAGAVVGVPCLQGSFTMAWNVVENATLSQSCETELVSAVAAEMEATAGCDTSLHNAVKKELRELINLGNETLSRYVSSVCDHARERVADATTFGAIAATANTNLDIKEFFDGGTYLNEEVGSIRTDDGVFINTVFQDVAQKELIEWPDIYNFQNCRAQAAMCCWVQGEQC
jgi:hypothetical protein